jgi:hypothetical protein
MRSQISLTILAFTRRCYFGREPLSSSDYDFWASRGSVRVASCTMPACEEAAWIGG